MLTIRIAEPEDAAKIANVQIKTWRAAYADILPKAYIASFTGQPRAIMWARIIERLSADDVVMVSENEDGEVVGYVSGGPIRSVVPGHTAEISSLYVLPGYQNEGHGRRLFMAASNRLAARGLEGLAVWVLRDNPATAFYLHLGGILVSSRTVHEADLTFDEVAYGWAETPSYG